MQVKKKQLELDMEQWTFEQWFKIGKEVRQCCILSPCVFNFYALYIMWNVRLHESQAGIKIARRDINNPRYAGDTSVMAESKEELRAS